MKKSRDKDFSRSPDEPQRKILPNEVAELTRVRVWLRSESNKRLGETADELARELARLKLGDRQRIEVLAKVLRFVSATKEH